MFTYVLFCKFSFNTFLDSKLYHILTVKRIKYCMIFIFDKKIIIIVCPKNRPSVLKHVHTVHNFGSNF